MVLQMLVTMETYLCWGRSRFQVLWSLVPHQPSSKALSAVQMGSVMEHVYAYSHTNFWYRLLSSNAETAAQISFKSSNQIIYPGSPVVRHNLYWNMCKHHLTCCCLVSVGIPYHAAIALPVQCGHTILWQEKAYCVHHYVIHPETLALSLELKCMHLVQNSVSPYWSGAQACGPASQMSDMEMIEQLDRLLHSPGAYATLPGPMCWDGAQHAKSGSWWPPPPLPGSACCQPCIPRWGTWSSTRDWGLPMAPEI